MDSEHASQHYYSDDEALADFQRRNASLEGVRLFQKFLADCSLHELDMLLNKLEKNIILRVSEIDLQNDGGKSVSPLLVLHAKILYLSLALCVEEVGSKCSATPLYDDHPAPLQKASLYKKFVFGEGDTTRAANSLKILAQGPVPQITRETVRHNTPLYMAMKGTARLFQGVPFDDREYWGQEGHQIRVISQQGYQK